MIIFQNDTVVTKPTQAIHEMNGPLGLWTIVAVPIPLGSMERRVPALTGPGRWVAHCVDHIKRDVNVCKNF